MRQTSKWSCTGIEARDVSRPQYQTNSDGTPKLDADKKPIEVDYAPLLAYAATGVSYTLPDGRVLTGPVAGVYVQIVKGANAAANGAAFDAAMDAQWALEVAANPLVVEDLGAPVATPPDTLSFG